MELLEKAKSTNDFGLRLRFPWTSSSDNGRQHNLMLVTNHSEKLFAMGKTSTPDATIHRVENPYLWGRYVLRYEELNADKDYAVVNERIVLHATTYSNALNIAANNFDWRLVHRGRFGQGVSFSENANYAHKYASNKGTYIIAGILVGKTTLGGYCTKIPSGDYDTTKDGRGFVFVKYYDDDFYPYYIVEC